jgi:hypothetical protein
MGFKRKPDKHYRGFQPNKCPLSPIFREKTRPVVEKGAFQLKLVASLNPSNNYYKVEIQSLITDSSGDGVLVSITNSCKPAAFLTNSCRLKCS